MTVKAVAAQLEWSSSKISRFETTKITVTSVDLKALLEVYGIDNAQHRERLITLARESRETPWWNQIDDRTPISGFKDFVGFEAEAIGIRTYEPLNIPGLLQTKEYARAIMVATWPDGADVEKALELRLERQRTTTLSDDPVDVTAIIDEAALRRPMGGEGRGSVMSDQVERLIELSEQTNVRILVLPFGSGPHPGMSGGFTILELPHPEDHGVVYVEGLTQGVLLGDEQSLERYRLVFDQVRQCALGSQASRDFLVDVRDEVEQG